MLKNYEEEYAAVNGIEHFLLHYPKAGSAPVLLYLHGGPGTFESLFAYAMDEAWGDMFTHVHWDQRGAGKTLRRNKGAGNPESLDQMLDDVHGIVGYLQKRYQMEKIVILGHSWGSLLGSMYVQRHPENVVAYIGTGQAVNMMENERMGYQQVLQMARQAGNQKHIRQLEQLGSYPPDDPEELMGLLPKLRKVQDHYEESSGIMDFIRAVVHSPSFRWADMISLLRAMQTNRSLAVQMLTFDLYAHPAQYKIPVHYILGERDTTTSAALAADYFETITAPSKTIAILPGAGHSPMYEQPEAFAEALRAVRESFASYSRREDSNGGKGDKTQDRQR